MLEMNLNEFNIDEDLSHTDPILQKENAKNYLLSIAKDVYSIFNRVILYLHNIYVNIPI